MKRTTDAQVRGCGMGERVDVALWRCCTVGAPIMRVVDPRRYLTRHS